jgi:hypothetical protein
MRHCIVQLQGGANPFHSTTWLCISQPMNPLRRCHQTSTRRTRYKTDLCRLLASHHTPNMQSTKEYTPTDGKLTTDSSAFSLKSFDDKSSIASTVKPLSSPKQQAKSAAKSAAKDTKASPKWYNKFSTQPEKPGEESWRDASLPDKERWKQWQKAKDREQARGCVTPIR